MQTKMQALFLSCLAVCAAFTVLASAQRVDTDPSAITVVENQENVTLHCRVGSPAKLCIINLPGVNQAITLDANEPSPVPGIQYYGQGVERGSCGVRIARITADNAGIMNCTLFVSGFGQMGSIDITVAFPPDQPTIKVVSGDSDIANLVVDTTLTFECTAARGNPAANISWLLDNELIYHEVHPQQPEEYFDERSNKRYFTAQSILVRTIRAEDNGKRLTCQAQHMAYPQGVSMTDLVLNVNFQPQALQDQVIYGLQVGRTSVATVTIISNPPPTIFWNIDGIDYHQGTENGRFAVPNPEPLGNNRYNVSLTIAGLTLEDLSRTYTLRASNAFGSEDYRVFLRSQGDATINESSTIGIGEIVGLVLAVLIVLTAIALIFVARATGRWCFRGASSSTSTSAAKIGETSDTESAEVKNPMTKAQRFKNIFAKGLQRGGSGVQAGSDLPEPVAPIPDVVVDEQDASKRQQHSGDAAETLAGGNTKPVKDDQTLVYAELELKPSEISFVNKPAPNESTEYAEILYVQQQQKQQQQQQQQQQQDQQQQQPGGAGEVGNESRTVPRSHSGDDNRPVIDVSLNKPSHKNADKGTAGGK